MTVLRAVLRALRRPAVLLGVILVALVVAGGLIALSGADPIIGLQGFVQGVSSSPYRVGELSVGAVPIAIVALTLIPALRAGIFSVGAEGQVAMGALLAAAAILGMHRMLGAGVPGIAYWVVGALAGCLAGGVFSLLPAFLKARWNVNEILSTLLLNYIASGILGWSLRTWLATGATVATPQSDPLPEAAQLPLLVPLTRAHAGILLVVVVAIVFLIWRRTASSTRIEVYAERPRLARRLGASRSGTIYGTILISGLGAGLVGWVQLAGLNDRLVPSVTGGVGFSGVAVALLGQLVPLGILASALFFSALSVGAAGIQSATGTVPTSIADVVKSVILLGVACVAPLLARRSARAPRSGGTAPEPSDADDRSAVDEPAAVTS